MTLLEERGGAVHELHPEQYSMPAYDGVDQPGHGPVFILFFGMMMADMGYGNF